jgi:hypothetical protein
VDFGMQPGFAHIIEDEQRFPDAFAQVIAPLAFYFNIYLALK